MVRPQILDQQSEIYLGYWALAKQIGITRKTTCHPLYDGRNADAGDNAAAACVPDMNSAFAARMETSSNPQDQRSAERILDQRAHMRKKLRF